MNEAIVSVGSNINPVENIRRAAEILEREQTLVDRSEIIITKPVGYQSQPDFLNVAFYVRTPLDRSTFNDFLKAIEKQLDRVKTAIKSGPRTIDLDLIIWNCQVVRDEFYDYDYVKLPVSELMEKHHILLQTIVTDSKVV